MDHLEALRQRQEIIIARVRSVALRYTNGVYLWGPPGTGKTHTVKETLTAELGKEGDGWVYTRAKMTDQGFFELLEENPSKVITLDDVVEVKAKGDLERYLLAACGNEDSAGSPRRVPYRRSGGSRVVEFSGGIVIISNLTTVNEALKSRLPYLAHDPTPEQLAALVREIARAGCPHYGLTARECAEVAEFVIEDCAKEGTRLDLRWLVDKGYPDRAMHKDGKTKVHWKTLLHASIVEAAVVVERQPETLAERTAKHRSEAREILRLFPTSLQDQYKMWEALGGDYRTRRTFDRLKQWCKANPSPPRHLGNGSQNGNGHA
jgi:hypothetical protein